ncbi:MAG TPA: HAMP domain-containing sensor histidine kinase [Micromonosporaceae bacterium]
MAEDFDAVRFFDEMTALIDDGTARSGLTLLRRIVSLARWSMDAVGVAFVEFGPAVGRVVAATGSAEIALGRRIESGDPVLHSLLRGDPVVRGQGSDLPDDVRSAVDIDRRDRFVLGRVTHGTRPIGMLLALVEPGNAGMEERRRSAMSYFGTVVARLYREDVGLPLHADPAPRVPPETTVLLDREGIVCWINPKSAAVLDGVEISLGSPLPLPMPGPGQVIEHNLPDGRWLKVMAHRLRDGAGESILIRDISEVRRWEHSRELFVALTSHELRTPVTVIKGYADTLNDRWDALDDHGRRVAARVLGQRAGELARLLDRLLTAVGEPGVPPMVSRFDLTEAVQEALGNLPADARDRIKVDLPEKMPTVFGERASMASVVSELLTNAAKYSSPGSGPVELEGVSDARTVGLRVSDRGIGVRPEHVETAFERFWQADTGDHRRYAGVGLGLYLVRRIVERQNGWVSLRPREQGGTVAEVRLPRGDLMVGKVPVVSTGKDEVSGEAER